MTFSKTMLPPILNYSYDGFRYESDTGGSVRVELPALLSVTNTVSEIDHLQVRIVSMNSNSRGLNESLFPHNIYFIKFNPSTMSSGQGRNFSIVLDTKINGDSIFSIGGEQPYPSYYRVQVRVKKKGTSDYNIAYGHNPSNEWLNSITSELSEWSNSAVIKTVKKPDVGVFTLTQDASTVIEKPDYTFQGFYYTDDENEPLVKYQMNLYKNGALFEKGAQVFIKEYETPYISHKFREVFQNNTPYIIELIVTTGSGYEYSTYYPLSFNLGFTKLYNIFDVEEDNEGAKNILQMFPKQIKLESSIPEESLLWLSDSSFNQFGEDGVNHLALRNSKISTPQNFNIPYEDFTILLSTGSLSDKVALSARDSINSDKLILKADGQLGATKMEVGIYRTGANSYRFFLREESSNLTNYYFYDYSGTLINREFIIMIKKHAGDTFFKVRQWTTNVFE